MYFSRRRKGTRPSPFTRRAQKRDTTRREENKKANPPQSKPEPEAVEQKPVESTPDVKPVENVTVVDNKDDNQETRGPGRPRSQKTIDRDTVVYNVVAQYPDGVSRSDIVDVLDKSDTPVPDRMVYGSLHRLRADGRIKRVEGRNRWVIA